MNPLDAIFCLKAAPETVDPGDFSKPETWRSDLCELDEASWCNATVGFLGSCQVLYKLGTEAEQLSSS